MQPSKSKNKGTRYQPVALYVVASLLFCTSVTIGISLEYDLPWINQVIALLPTPHLIHWRTRTEAWAECQKTKKPILYVVTGKKDSVSMLFEAQCMGDPKIAELIDSEFIPVHHTTDVRSRHPEKDEELKYYRDTLGMGYNSYPWVFVVPYSMHDLSANDLTSSANLVELGINSLDDLCSDNPFYPNANYYDGGYNYRQHYVNGRCSGQRGAAMSYGYTSKADFLDFLYGARIWHKLPPTLGRIKWMDIANLDVNTKGGKPKMLALVSDVGLNSDTMRMNLFWKKKSVELINKEFDPYLIEFHRLDPDYNKKFKALRDQYHVDTLPALIVLNPRTNGGTTQVEHGFNTMLYSVDFLNSTLHKKSSDKKVDAVHYRNGVRDETVPLGVGRDEND